jgi:exopolyphosphatase/guanosine-5'-triphosphate,3'-diphosphate pyrophosphatase
VREAKDGKAFAARMEAESGIKLRILSGEDEARLSALGVSAGAPDAKGIVGDLGGASLELIEISPKGVGRGETFPVGPLTLMDGGDSTTAASASRSSRRWNAPSCSTSAAVISMRLAARGVRWDALISR